MSVYEFSANTMDGKSVSLDRYQGKGLLIVNTASKCGFTPQYQELQALYDQYHDQGLEILGFPCNQFGEQEPGTGDEIMSFCQVNYGVTFPIFEKIEVRGQNAHPLFIYLTEQAPFKGFDLNHPIGERLSSVLQERFPEILEGDSIKWNFTKFLIDKEGNLAGRYEPTTAPATMKEDIEALLKR